MKLQLKKSRAPGPTTPDPLPHAPTPPTAAVRPRRSRREPLAAFCFGALLMGFIQSASYEPSGRDSFYHIKMAVLLPEMGFPDRFEWLRHTILYQRNVSHHHGFHVMMVPFVYASQGLANVVPQSLREWAAEPGSFARLEYFKVGLRRWLDSPYILGGKVLNILLFGMVVLMIDLILRQLQVGWRLFWVPAVAALPTDFLLRMSYIRAPVASLAVLLLVIYCILKRRYLWVAVLGALYCHIYGGFVFFPIVTGCFAVSLLPAGRWKDAALLVGWTFAGVVVGLISHPFFPENLDFLKIQLFETGLQTSGRRVGVGSEWKPINPEYWVQISAFVLVVMVITLVFRLDRRRLGEPVTLALLLLNVIFLGLCLTARRFIEYWPVFALLSAAAMWQGASTSWLAVLEQLNGPARSHLIYCKQRSYVILLLVMAGVGGVTAYQARLAARCKFDVVAIQQAMAFLEEDSSPGELVFADDWDEFPLYFYYNHHNHYVCGLDPQFTNSMAPELWERFCVITQGRAPRLSTITVPDSIPGESPEDRTFLVHLEDIRSRFGARYVLVDNQHQAFYRQLRQDKIFEYAYPQTLSGQVPQKVDALAVFRVLPAD